MTNLLHFTNCHNLPPDYSADVLKASPQQNAAAVCITALVTLLCFAVRASVRASEESDRANGLRWEDGSGKVLFAAADIVRFDWERQVFELKREAAMDLMSFVVAHRDLQRGFSVRDDSGELYRGRLVSPASSQSYDEPTILTGVIAGIGQTPPFYSIDGGYPGTMGSGEKKRFNPRLHDDLEEAGLLKTIPPTEKPNPIERIHTEWCGERNQYRLRAEIFPESFRLGQTVRVHLFFTPPAETSGGAGRERELRARLAAGQSAMPTLAFDTVEIRSTLVQTNGFNCTTDHSIPEKLTPETIKAGIHLLRWKPWGPVFGADRTTAEAGPATISFELILRKQTTNGQEVVCTPIIPPQELTILP